jgi:hypothetical protein
MHRPTSTGSKRAADTAQIADSLVRIYGEEALLITERQIAESSGDVRVSWETILSHVRIALHEREAKGRGANPDRD